MGRIVLLSNIIPNPRIRKRIQTFASSRHEVSFIYWNRKHSFGPKIIREKNVSFHEIEGSSSLQNITSRFFEIKRLTKKTLRKLEEIKPDLIYAFHVECIPAAELYTRKRGGSLIIEISDLPGTRFIKSLGVIGKVLLKIIDKKISIADALVVTSPYFFQNYYRDRIKISREKVFVLENIPKKSVFKNFRKSSSEKIRIGFVGAPRYSKSLKTLIQAASDNNNIEVVIAGAGPEQKEIQEEAKKSTNVRMIDSYDYEKDIANIYSSLDLVYAVYNPDLLNVRLALPNKLYEAIVCELPIIVASGTCLEKYVKELDVGFSVPHGDVKALRELLKFLLEQPGVIKRVSMKEKRIKNEYFYENIEPQFLEWIEDVLGKPKE